MPFVKGKSGNPNGKEAGTKSKKTIEWESFGHDILSNGSERAKKIMSSCDDEMFMDYYVKLLEYFKPKLARTEVKQDGTIETNITFKRDK